MTSLMTRPVILFLSWVVVAQCRAEGNKTAAECVNTPVTTAGKSGASTAPTAPNNDATYSTRKFEGNGSVPDRRLSKDFGECVLPMYDRPSIGLQSFGRDNVVSIACAYLPISFLDFSAFVNGRFDNLDLGSEDRLHDRIEINWKPVLIPGLQKDPLLYFEEVLNGKLYRRILVARNESSTDNILYLTYYNFTDSNQYKSESFNTDDLTNLTREDVDLADGCQFSYTKLSPGVLLGDSFDCRHSVNGKHPVYTIYLTCDSFRFEPGLASDETTSLVAYDLKHKGPRYPLIDPPEGYVNPCQGGQ